MPVKIQNNNKLKYALSIFVALLISITGCKKDDAASPNGGKTILKYEIISTIPFTVLPTSNYSLSVSYTNATGQTQVEQTTITSATWTKTVELTSTQRPLGITLGGSGFTNGVSGSVTINIYENDILKATNIGSVSASGIQGVGLAFLPTLYYLKQ
jgi:hypothetical protein